MHPVHDVDALLMLATALSSKRRPAELVEIIAAADLIQEGAVPPGTKLAEAFERLGVHGLICEAEGGYQLTPAAEAVMTGQPRKADSAERLFIVKEKLAAYTPAGQHAPVVVTVKQLDVAIIANRAAAQSAAKNLLVPKPKPAEGDAKRPGLRQRKPLPARRRKV